MSQQHTPVTWTSLKGGLPVIISIVVLIVTLATFAAGMQQQLNYLDARLCIIEDEQRTSTQWTRSIEVRLAEIQRDIAYIRVELNKQEK